MKILRDGKEVKNAEVIYHANGAPSLVVVDGVNYDASAFEFKDEDSKKKTKPASKTKQAKSGAMTTEDLK